MRIDGTSTESDLKYKHDLNTFHCYRNYQSIWITSLEYKITPLQISLVNGGETFWLDNRTLGHVVEGEDGIQDFYAISVDVATDPARLSTPKRPVLLGSFPAGVSAANFKYTPAGEMLVFSASVWPDSSLETVKEQDERWENRGTSALIYEETYVRHWDHYILPKRSELFSVKLSRNGEEWSLESTFNPLMKGLKHVSLIN